jgi:SAM-dependent methyltransferase
VHALPDTPSQAAYDPIAAGYDLLTADWPYAEWLDAIERLAIEHGLAGPRVLDAACGTGKSFLPLLDRGYRITAVDASPAMAAIAAAKAGDRAVVRVADVRALPRYGDGFDLITCLDDVVNHLPAEPDVVLAFQSLRRNLAPGGLLIFDVNTLAAYRDAPTLVAEDARHVVIWQGEGARLERAGETGRVRMQVLERCAGGMWRREAATWPHRHYTLRRLEELLHAAGLRLLDVRGQLSGARLQAPPDEDVHPKLLLVATSREMSTGSRGNDELAPVS